MRLNKIQENWDSFGRTDPLWSILTDPNKKGNKWRIDDFFATGIKEIEEVMEHIDSLGIHVLRRKALDFGCGVGRLSQALALYFDEVYGVDIAPSMIEHARKYNLYDGKCKYFINDKNELKLFDDNSFDLIYTSITLQHMHPRYSKKYIKEFLRILSKNGLLIFQIPSEIIGIKQINIGLKRKIKKLMPPILSDLYIELYRKLKHGNQAIMEMYGINRNKIINLIEENNAKIIDIKRDQRAGKEWISYQYFVARATNVL